MRLVIDLTGVINYHDFMTTRYENVAQEIRRLIREGIWPAGQRIPTEPQLCEQFHVSRTTIRQAVQILSQEGLLICRQGLGTFVLNHETARKPIGLSNFSDLVLSGQLNIRRQLVSFENVPAGEQQARALKMIPGSPLLTATRVDHIDNQPISIDRCFIPAQNADKLSEADLASPLFYFTWEEKQELKIQRIEQSIHTEPATPDDCALLKLKSSVWMLVLNETFYDIESRVTGMIITRYRGDTSKLTTTVFSRYPDGAQKI